MPAAEAVEAAAGAGDAAEAVVQRVRAELAGTVLVSDAATAVRLTGDHPQVRAVCVSTEKPDVYPDCDAVGVEVFRIKED